MQPENIQASEKFTNEQYEQEFNSLTLDQAQSTDVTVMQQVQSEDVLSQSIRELDLLQPLSEKGTQESQPNIIQGYAMQQNKKDMLNTVYQNVYGHDSYHNTTHPNLVSDQLDTSDNYNRITPQHLPSLQTHMTHSQEDHDMHPTNLLYKAAPDVGGTAVQTRGLDINRMCARLYTFKHVIPFTQLQQSANIEQVILRLSPTSQSVQAITYVQTGGKLYYWHSTYISSDFSQYDDFNFQSTMAKIALVGYSSTAAQIAGLVSGAIFNSQPDNLVDFNFDSANGCLFKPLTAARIVEGVAVILPPPNTSLQLEQFQTTSKYECYQDIVIEANQTANEVIHTFQKVGQVRMISESGNSSDPGSFVVYRPTYNASTNTTSMQLIGTLSSANGNGVEYRIHPRGVVNVLPGDYLSTTDSTTMTSTLTLRYRFSDQSGANHRIGLFSFTGMTNLSDVSVEIVQSVEFTPSPSSYQYLGQLQQARVIPYADALIATQLYFSLPEFGFNPVMLLTEYSRYKEKLQQLCKEPQFVVRASAGMFSTPLKVMQYLSPYIYKMWQGAKPTIQAVGQEFVSDIANKVASSVDSYMGGPPQGRAMNQYKPVSNNTGLIHAANTKRGFAMLHSARPIPNRGRAAQQRQYVYTYDPNDSVPTIINKLNGAYPQVQRKPRTKGYAMINNMLNVARPNINQQLKNQQQELPVQVEVQPKEIKLYDLVPRSDDWLLTKGEPTHNDQYIGFFPLVIEDDQQATVAYCGIVISYYQYDGTLISKCTDFNHPQQDYQTYEHQGRTLHLSSYLRGPSFENAPANTNVSNEQLAEFILQFVQQNDVYVDILMPKNMEPIQMFDYSYSSHLTAFCLGIRQPLVMTGAPSFELGYLQPQPMNEQIMQLKILTTTNVLSDDSPQLILYVSSYDMDNNPINLSNVWQVMAPQKERDAVLADDINALSFYCLQQQAIYTMKRNGQIVVKEPQSKSQEIKDTKQIFTLQKRTRAIKLPNPYVESLYDKLQVDASPLDALSQDINTAVASMEAKYGPTNAAKVLASQVVQMAASQTQSNFQTAFVGALKNYVDYNLLDLYRNVPIISKHDGKMILQNIRLNASNTEIKGWWNSNEYLNKKFSEMPRYAIFMLGAPKLDKKFQEALQLGNADKARPVTLGQYQAARSVAPASIKAIIDYLEKQTGEQNLLADQVAIIKNLFPSLPQNEKEIVGFFQKPTSWAVTYNDQQYNLINILQGKDNAHIIPMGQKDQDKQQSQGGNMVNPSTSNQYDEQSFFGNDIPY